MAVKRRTVDPSVLKWPKTAVYAKLGDFPLETDEQPHWRFLRLDDGLGTVPVCHIERDLGIGAANKRVKDINLGDRVQWVVEVWNIDPVTGDRTTPVFVGQIVEQGFKLAEGAEVETATATIPVHWFGPVCKGQDVYDPQQDEIVTVHHDLEFNPMVDGLVIGNARAVQSDFAGFDAPILFVDPESTRTESARELHVGTLFYEVREWTFRDMLSYLTGRLNEDEQFIKNPEIDEDFADDAPPIRNLVLPRGRRLLDYLSTLLPMFGYDWRIKCIDDAERGGAFPQLEVFERGLDVRNAVDLELDEIGESVNKSQVEQLDMTVNVGSMASKVTIHGALKEVQFTLPLYPGWPSSEDATVTVNTPYTIAGKIWIANEGGDYTDLRAEIDDPPDLGADFVTKNRKAENTYLLVLGNEASYVVVEWRSPDTSWQRIPTEWGWTLLTNRVGIVFSKPPLQLVESGVEVRITCILRADKRVETTWEDEDSLLDDEVETLIDMSDRYFYRQIQDTGDYEAQVGISSEFEIDDSQSQEMQDHAERIGLIQRAASVAGAIVIDGYHPEVHVGQLVRKITGRNIEFNAVKAGSGEAYPTITGVTYEHRPNCKTHLTLSPYTSTTPEQLRRKK